jgi:signal transduction histidine kinase
MTRTPQYLGNFWQVLTRPHRSIQCPYEQRRARILSPVLLSLWLLFIIAIFVQASTFTVISTAALFSIPYLVSRTRYFANALPLATTIIIYSIMGQIAQTNVREIDINAYLQWFVLPMTLGSFLLVPRKFLFFVGLICGLSLMLKIIFPAIPTFPFWGAWSYVFTIGVLLVVASFVQEYYFFRPQINEIKETQAALLTKNKELDELNQSLEQRVQERTQALETALQQAYSAVQVKNEFLSVMSHELRTPLNAIIGYQELVLLSDNLDEDNALMLNYSLENADRLLTLINDMLDLNRLELGDYKVHYNCIHLKNFLNKFEKQMRLLADQKALDLQISVDPHLPEMVQADEKILHKILFHLVANAIKFTENGSVSVTVGKVSQQLRIIVQDSGIGIPAEMHHAIFESFRQVDSTSRRKYGGSGLGLSIVQQLCEILNGRIEVASVVNQGSTFTVCLPLIVRQA